jgi:hypothetical protein
LSSGVKNIRREKQHDSSPRALPLALSRLSALRDDDDRHRLSRRQTRGLPRRLDLPAGPTERGSRSGQGGVLSLKSLHICHEPQMADFRTNRSILTCRTGWIPDYIEDEIINIYIHQEGKEKGKQYIVRSIQPARFHEIEHEPIFQEEITGYHRKFHPMKYFFTIFLDPVI